MENSPNRPAASNFKTIIFMVILSFICALILSTLASALKEPQEKAKELDRSKQMLIAARIINPKGYFQIKDEKGEFVPAKFDEEGSLILGDSSDVPTQNQILDIYKARIHPLLVDDKGHLKTFQDAGLKEDKYTAEFRKTGYYRQPLKLLYSITANAKKDVDGYVIPVNGFGLWDAIYGYLALETDGDTVIGISWYDQKETPGLGANISEPEWQSLFPHKRIFMANSDGKTDINTALLGLTVIKGKVSEVYGSTPKAWSSIDGMAGATLTGNGVTNAYKDVLAGYRPFLQKLYTDTQNSSVKEKK